jgi:hypothetical protein
VTLYNPHLLARDELVETFVGRQVLLDELVDDLRRGGRQHHLLVGNRGSGKTTLLLRLALAVEDDPKLAKTCIPARFPEEQYNVSRLSDFWMNAINALIDALERRNDRVAVQRLESSLAELEPLAEEERARRALAVLERWTKQARRLIVLLVDNMDLVLDRLSDSLWPLREALSIDNGLALVGASSKFLEQAIDYASPFYDFFAVHELGPLSEEEARRLVLALARRAGTTNVAEVFDRDPGRFKALYVLTGGTPRTLALLHTVLALEQGDRIERDLDGLLDQLTPYYKARFDDLPSQSQVVVDKVALHWHPITAAQCQAATHLEINAVSAQLNRLVKSGLLTKVALPAATRLGFQISERFFNIWYLMRASRRMRRRLAWFVEFLRLFYGEEDLQRRAQELIESAPADSVNSPAKLLAFASAVPDEALRRRLEFRAIYSLMSKGSAALREAMDLEGEDIHVVRVVDRVRALREIREQIVGTELREWPPGETSQSIAEKVTRSPRWSIATKQHVALVIHSGNSEQRAMVLGHVIADEKGFDILLGERLLSAIASGEAPSLIDVAGIADARLVLGLADSRSGTVVVMLVTHLVQDRPPSEEFVEELLLLEPAAAEELLSVAAVAIGRVDWVRVRSIVLLVARRVSGTGVSALTTFLRRCISSGLAAEALDLLVEAGIPERWTPLFEAMRAIVDREPARLDGLAPEMRVVARELYDQLLKPEPTMADPAGDEGSVGSSDTVVQRSKRRQPGKRRKRAR